MFIEPASPRSNIPPRNQRLIAYRKRGWKKGDEYRSNDPKFLSWTSFTGGGNSTNPFDEFPGIGASFHEKQSPELSRGAEASQVYDRDFFFGFMARHPSLGQWTGAIAPSERRKPVQGERENSLVSYSYIWCARRRRIKAYKNISFFPLRRPSLDLTRMMDRQYHAALKWCNRDARMHVICRNDIFNHELLSTIVKRKSTFITGTRRALCELSTLIIARTGCYRIVIGKKRVVVGSEMIQLLIFFSFFLFWIRY